MNQEEINKEIKEITNAMNDPDCYERIQEIREKIDHCEDAIVKELFANHQTD